MANAKSVSAVDVFLKSLRDSGHKVRVSHFRLYDVSDLDRDPEEKLVEFSNFELRLMKEAQNDGDLSGDSCDWACNVYDPLAISHKGGRTTIEVTLTDGTKLMGEALCSLDDNFNRKVGKRVAFNRLMDSYDLYMKG